MNSRRWSILTLLLLCSQVEANPLRNYPVLKRTNRKLAGQVLDYTRNHGSDNRIYSPALDCKRDLYVYLPPGYDPCKSYPLVLWLHGFAQEEISFCQDVVEPLDAAIACGKLPPMIMASPDGTLKGRACYTDVASFFVNSSRGGKFEDYLMIDVWDFLHEHFPIRPEREAHIIAGVSMGAGAAFNKAFKYPERFHIVVGIFPPLNTRWENSRGRYRANFDPNDWNYRTDFSRKLEPVGRYNGIVFMRLGQILRPLYGWNAPDLVEQIAAENPIELLVSRNVQDGQYSMYIAYGGRDEFNVDAQVESFLYVANQLGITTTVAYDPRGRHNRSTAQSFIPGILDWLEPQLAHYREE